MTDKVNMSKTLKRIFTFILTLNILLPSIGFTQTNNPYGETCQQLLNWIYKELTVKNLEKSIERTNKKLLASMLITIQNNKSIKLKNHPELLTLWKSMKELDPEFEGYLKENKPYKKFRSYGFFTQLFGGLTYESVNSLSYFDAVKSWSDLQTEHPEYFKDLPRELKIDKWDLVTSKLVEDAGKLKYEGDDKETVLSNITKLSNRLKRLSFDHSERLALEVDDINEIKTNLEQLQNGIVSKMKDIYKRNKDEFAHICSEDDFDKLITQNPENYVCPIEQSPSDSLSLIQDNLISLANIIPDIDSLNLVYKPEVPVLASEDDGVQNNQSEVAKLCPIEIDYMKVEQPREDATYNMRSNAMVDTIVIHHTGTGTNLKTNAESIHRGHIDNTTDNDAWYMIGYNYLVSLGGNGSSIKKPAIITGRDSSFRGAHAGGNTLPLSIDQLENLLNTYQYFNCKEQLDKNPMNTNKIKTKNICQEKPEQRVVSRGYNCGALASNIASLQEDGSISGNMTSIGVAIIGNFAHHSSKSFMGVDIANATTLNVSQVKSSLVPKLVKLINALKKDYPNITKIVPHSYFKKTLCPGTVANILKDVAYQTGLKVYLSKNQDRNENNYRYAKTQKYKGYLNIIKKLTKIENEIIELKTKLNKLEILNTNEQVANFNFEVKNLQKNIREKQIESFKLISEKDKYLENNGGLK